MKDQKTPLIHKIYMKIDEKKRHLNRFDEEFSG